MRGLPAILAQIWKWRVRVPIMANRRLGPAGGFPMTEAPKSTPTPDAPPLEYGKADSILFQAWLVLFLVVICFALVNYLVSYI